MTRAELLRIAADLVETVDEKARVHVQHGLDTQFQDDMQELREILATNDDETVTEAARREVRDHKLFEQRVRRALGLGPEATEDTFNAIARVMTRLSELNFESQRSTVQNDALKAFVDFDGQVRQALKVPGFAPKDGETTIAAVKRLIDEVELSFGYEARDIAARKVLGAKNGETTEAAAERAIDKLRQLVQQQDDYDKQIGEIIGIPPAADVMLALKHMVQELKEARRRLEGRDVG